MNRTASLASASCALTWLSAGVAGAFTLSVDPAPLSIAFDQFNDGVDTATAFNNMASAGEAGGVSNTTVNPGASDPQFQYPTPGAIAPFDANAFPYFRIQAQRSAGGAGDGIFPLPPAGSTRVPYNAGTTFAESQFTFPTAAPGVSGDGFRIDPIGGGTGTTELFGVDYIFLDRFPTIGLAEFDRDGGLDGWVPNGHLSTPTVSASTSSFTATTSGVDPILQRGGLNIDTSTYTTLEVSLAVDPASNSRFEFFWGTDTFPGPAGGQSIAITSEVIRDGNLHTYRFDMSDEPAWDGNLNILRLDLLADGDAAAGRSVEVGHVRLMTAVPEPSGVALIGLAAAGLGLRRRRPAR